MSHHKVILTYKRKRASVHPDSLCHKEDHSSSESPKKPTNQAAKPGTTTADPTDESKYAIGTLKILQNHEKISDDTVESHSYTNCSDKVRLEKETSVDAQPVLSSGRASGETVSDLGNLSIKKNKAPLLTFIRRTKRKTEAVEIKVKIRVKEGSNAAELKVGSDDVRECENPDAHINETERFGEMSSEKSCRSTVEVERREASSIYPPVASNSTPPALPSSSFKDFALNSSPFKHTINSCSSEVTKINLPTLSSSIESEIRGISSDKVVKVQDQALNLFPGSDILIKTDDQITNNKTRQAKSQPKSTSASKFTLPDLNIQTPAGYENQREFTSWKAHKSTDQTRSLLGPLRSHQGNRIFPSFLLYQHTFSRKVNPFINWSEEELDCLWIGVRRHGLSNWSAVLRDPRLKFSNQKTPKDLVERWAIEQARFLGFVPRQNRDLNAANPVLTAGNFSAMPANGLSFHHWLKVSPHAGPSPPPAATAMSEPGAVPVPQRAHMFIDLNQSLLEAGPEELVVLDSEETSEETISDNQVSQP